MLRLRKRLFQELVGNWEAPRCQPYPGQFPGQVTRDGLVVLAGGLIVWNPTRRLRRPRRTGALRSIKELSRSIRQASPIRLRTGSPEWRAKRPLLVYLAVHEHRSAHLISKLGLVPLPREGGFFAPIWTSPDRGPDGRPSGSAILFLLTMDHFSALHRLRGDELWHFHAGDPAELVLLDPSSGAGRTLVLGPDVANDHLASAVAPAGCWQGARIRTLPAGVPAGGPSSAAPYRRHGMRGSLSSDAERSFPGHFLLIARWSAP